MEVGDCVYVGSVFYKYEGNQDKIILRHFNCIFLEELISFLVLNRSDILYCMYVIFRSVFLRRHVRGYRGYF